MVIIYMDPRGLPRAWGSGATEKTADADAQQVLAAYLAQPGALGGVYRRIVRADIDIETAPAERPQGA